MATREEEMRKKVLKEIADRETTKDAIKIKGYYAGGMGGYYPYSPYYPTYGRPYSPYMPYNPYYGRWGGPDYLNDEMESILDDLIDEISIRQPSTTDKRKNQPPVMGMAAQQDSIDLAKCQTDRCTCLESCDHKTDVTQRILCRVTCILTDCYQIPTPTTIT